MIPASKKTLAEKKYQVSHTFKAIIFWLEVLGVSRPLVHDLIIQGQ